MAPKSPECRQFQRLVANKRRCYASLGREPASEHEVNRRIGSSTMAPDVAAPVLPDRIWLSLRGFESQPEEPCEHHSADAGAGAKVTPAGKQGPMSGADLGAAADWLKERKDKVLDDLRCLGEQPSGRLYVGQCPPGSATVVMAEVEAQGREDSCRSVVGSTDNPHVVQDVGGWVLTAGPPPPGTRIRLPTKDLFFAHDNQSERFGPPGGGQVAAQRQTVLQTALELWAGHLSPEKLPDFSVVWHEGRWHVRTGNRRLMAWRLLRLYAPDRFKEVDVLVAETSVEWVRLRYTAVKNGPGCHGAWMKVRETGEFVGIERASFGQDLLQLVCGPTTQETP